jgi:acyl dehydratase
VTRRIPLTDLPGMVGEHLGYSSWHEVTQDQVDRFAEVTGDRQWIHVDPERARETSYGGTIAHGYLTLSLIPALQAEIWEPDGAAMAVNYGSNRVRMHAQVMVGCRLRVGAQVVSVEARPGGMVELVQKIVVQIEGRTRPACVAETIIVLLGAPGADNPSGSSGSSSAPGTVAVAGAAG